MFGPDSNEKPREYKRRRKIIETAELPIASAEVRDNTYSNLLSLLTLCPTHQASLKERGLTRDEIDWLGYRTTPTTRLRRIVTELLERGCVLDGVPGFYCQKDTGQWTLDIRGSGIMLPDRNLNGQIEAIQVRLDKVYNQKFYNLTSIDQYYGTQSKCCPHYVGVHEGDEVVCLTEGVMKADIAYSFALGTSYESGFVGLTGVPSYSQFERALEELIHKGMHEPIVSKELFDKVQGILSARQSEQGLATIYDSKSKRRSMFKGILRCGECGRSMYLRSKSNRGYYYYCTLHENYNATICPKKAVKQEDVESLALRLIQTQIRAFSDAQRLIANLNATPSSQTRYQIYETQIDDAKRKIEKFNQLKAALYGDFADGLLSHQDYTDLSEDYSRRADDLRIFIAELEKEKGKYSAGFGSKMQWALLIEKYKDQESLDAEMAAAFIETLTLFNDGHVEVAFRHRDEIEQVLYIATTRGKEAERYAG